MTDNLPTRISFIDDTPIQSDGGKPPVEYSNDAIRTGLPPGVEFSDEQLPAIQGFRDAMSAVNVPRDHVDRVLQWYSNRLEQAHMDQDDSDLLRVEETRERMRSEWGDSYRGRLDVIRAIFDTAPEELELEYARLPNGTRMVDHPNFLRWLSGLLNDELRYSDNESDRHGTERSERLEIEEILRNDSERYFSDSRLQARYRELLEREYPI